MNVLNELNQILQDRFVTDKPVNPNAHLLKDLEMDSLDILDMVMEVEDRFDIMIAQADLLNVHTLNDLAILVKDKMK